eukprot:1159585-Pelagomonas_calceolata.AAC.7
MCTKAKKGESQFQAVAPGICVHDQYMHTAAGRSHSRQGIARAYKTPCVRDQYMLKAAGRSHSQGKALCPFLSSTSA